MIVRKKIVEGLMFPKEIPFKIVTSRALADKAEALMPPDYPLNLSETTFRLNMDQLCSAYSNKERIVIQY